MLRSILVWALLCVASLLHRQVSCYRIHAYRASLKSFRSLSKYPLATCLYAKKDNKHKFSKKEAPPSKGEKQGREDRFDAMTRRFMFTIQGLNKVLPDGSRTILKNINLCFYPGAKIGVVGSNGSGK